MSKEQMLQVKNLHKSYFQQASRLHVLKGIDLTIDKGEVVAIVGPSGAGKSTLLHIVGGLDKPEEGEVIFDGRDLYKLKENERAKVRNRQVGFVFQFYHLLPEFTALENVILPALVKEKIFNVERVKSQGSRLLEKVGLEGRQAHKPQELSGGEQQRVAIARALINSPDVLLCDEPTGNLDSESGKQIIELLLDLNRKNKQTLVIVTHDDSIARQAHRIVHIRDGRLVSSSRNG